MTSANRNSLVVNVLYWIVAASLHPLASILTTGTGEQPKIFSLLIPLVFIGLAFGSTFLLSSAQSQATKT
ncbi:hypothetical protein [Planctomicrobium piriforme]|uniref:Uncharacterized protein n=1 Tax=Planctomicrobium piriforme TaxID=1576369 RepID=A0A1I3BCM6_9PLAN|nr:hypothetical protein [Planctomicrobium piriforme]SFH59900.1 hypothetical protein SAMN05421753_101372 [Planctomicrobium piriforme]